MNQSPVFLYPQQTFSPVQCLSWLRSDYGGNRISVVWKLNINTWLCVNMHRHIYIVCLHVYAAAVARVVMCWHMEGDSNQPSPVCLSVLPCQPGQRQERIRIWSISPLWQVNAEHWSVSQPSYRNEKTRTHSQTHGLGRCWIRDGSKAFLFSTSLY